MNKVVENVDIPSPRATKSLLSRRAPLAPPGEQLKVLNQLKIPGHVLDFDKALGEAGWPKLTRDELAVFQINIGKLCNMTCRHCHVDSGPDRVDANMDRETVEHCLEALDKTDAHTVDLTGGAP
ncbi:MAG: radical SAM protein, partial [Myxococcota bacterium]